MARLRSGKSTGAQLQEDAKAEEHKKAPMNPNLAPMLTTLLFVVAFAWGAFALYPSSRVK